MSDALRVVLEQTAPAPGGVRANATRIAAAAGRHGNADLILFPELALTGYDLGRRTEDVAVDLRKGSPVPRAGDGPTIVAGLAERGEDHLVYNSAVALRGERLVAVHRKRYLPTYGMFDEGRRFAPGRRSVRPFALAPGWRAGILICEDLWHPALAYLLALQEADVLLVPAAAPGRRIVQEPEAPEDVGAALASAPVAPDSPATPASGPAAEAERPPRPVGWRFASLETWELIARTTALLHGVYVLLCNRAGVEGAVTFAGGSRVVAPDGEVVARAPEAEEATLEVTLERDRVRQARRTFSHLRDEDPACTLHALERILRER